MHNITDSSTPYGIFLKAVKEAIPERGKLTNRLMDVLLIEREAVYRRLRGDVPFSFVEIAAIAKEFEISLDNMIASTSKSRPSLLKMVDYNNFGDEDYDMLENFLYVLKSIEDDPDSEIGGSMNIIPQSLCLEYRIIYKFYLFKWMYQFGSTDSLKHFHQINPPQRLLDINKEIIQTSRKAGTSIYIIDQMTLNYLANDVKYFLKIQLIKPEEVDMLKNELLNFLDMMERFSQVGCFENGHKMQIYVSSVNFETSYSYIESATHHLSMIKTFTINDITSPDERIFQNLKRWIQSLKRTSTLISGSGDIERVTFFKKQRDIVENIGK